MSETLTGPGVDLALVFATWVYLLHGSGIQPDDPGLVEHCAAVDAAGDGETGDAAGLALVRRVMALMGDGEPAAQAVLAVARGLYGERLSTDLGEGTRADRAGRIRRYQFTAGLPWLARIYERKADGAVAPTWLLVERVTDLVRAMDPNPWDDIDEERDIPWPDFMVLWELDDCTSAYVA